MDPKVESKSGGRVGTSGASHHARVAMSRLLEDPSREPVGDQRLAALCFDASMVDLGVSFSLRAAAAFRERGQTEASEQSLAAAERHARKMRPEAVERLANERCAGGDAQGAATLLSVAAAHRLTWGHPEPALRLCVEAARRCEDAPGLSRTWALASLCVGDPHGAWPLVERWVGEEPESLEAAAWAVETCRRTGRTDELAVRFARLRELAGSPSPEELHLQIRAQLAEKGRAVVLTPLPFWLEYAPEPRAPSGTRRPRVWLGADFVFGHGRLAALLGDAGFEVVSEATGDAGGGKLDLAVLPFETPEAMERTLVDFWRTTGREAARLLVVPRGELASVDFSALRRFGVVGVLHPFSGVEAVLERVAQCVDRSGRERRLHARMSVDLPVAVHDARDRSEQRLDSLSCRGLRLRSRRPFELNQEIGLRFSLGGVWIVARGRVIYCRPSEKPGAAYSVGVFFLELGARQRGHIEAEVEWALAAPAAPGPPPELPPSR